MFSHEDYYILSCNLASESEYVNNLYRLLISILYFLICSVQINFWYEILSIFFAECFNLGICR